MKALTLELHEDQTFNARITHDGRVIAAASGNVGLVTATGAVREFAAILGAMAAQSWHQTTGAEVPGPKPWEISRMEGLSGEWLLHLPGNGIMYFPFESSAISGRAYLRPIWDVIVHPPSSIYEAFYAPDQSWGFITREGVRHAGFQSREEAQAHADKIHDLKNS